MIETLSALAEPHRLRIVELLRRRPHTVGEIGRRLRLAQPQVSKHLRVLRTAGLVQVRPRAQQRFYALRPQPLWELDAWLEPYRRFWNERLDALEKHLDSMDAPAPQTRNGRRR